MSYVLQFFIAAVATVTFAILFAAPKKELIFAVFQAGLPGWFILFCTGSRGMWFWAVWWQPLF